MPFCAQIDTCIWKQFNPNGRRARIAEATFMNYDFSDEYGARAASRTHWCALAARLAGAKRRIKP